jgi:chromosome segregation ATPase
MVQARSELDFEGKIESLISQIQKGRQSPGKEQLRADLDEAQKKLERVRDERSVYRRERSSLRVERDYFRDKVQEMKQRLLQVQAIVGPDHQKQFI